MQNKLLNKLVSDDKLRFESYFLNMDIEQLKKLSIDQIKNLLEISNTKIRFDAIESIVNPFIIDDNPQIVTLIINIFKNVKNEAVASYVNFIVSSEDLFEAGNIKYFILLDTVSILLDDEKACYISNIFWNKNVYVFQTSAYINALLYSLNLSNQELEVIENEVCINKDVSRLFLKK